MSLLLYTLNDSATNVLENKFIFEGAALTATFNTLDFRCKIVKNCALYYYEPSELFNDYVY